MIGNKKTLLLLYFSLSFLVFLRLLPFLFPNARFWGFNHLIFLPPAYTAAFFIITGIALILPFFRQSEQWGVSLAKNFSNIFYSSRLRFLYRAIFVLIMMVLFIIFAAPTHFLGDGYEVIKNLVSEKGTLFKWSEIGVIQFMRMIRFFVGPPDELTAKLTFQIVSILSGTITIYFFFLISNIATENSIRRFIIFIASLLSGTLLLFFGYSEYYPIIWLFLAAFVYFSLRYQKTGEGLYIALLIIFVGSLFHLQMILFIPAAIYVSLSRGRGLHFYRRFKALILGIMIIMAAVLLAVLIHKYTTDIFIEHIFLPLFNGKPIDPNYAIFSVSHFLDIFNETILISPLLIFLIIANGKYIKNVIGDKNKLFLGLASVGSLLFLLVIDPKLAMPRDWDLLSPLTFTVMLLLIFNIPSYRINDLKRLLVSTMIILIILPIPYLMTNLNGARSIRYIEYLISLDATKSLSSTVLLYDYYKSKGNVEKSDSLRNIYNRSNPNKRKIEQALKSLEYGDLPRALTIIPEIVPDRFNGDYQAMQAKYHHLQGNHTKALDHIEKAIQLRRYQVPYYLVRSEIHTSLMQYEEAYEDLCYGYQFNQSFTPILIGLAFANIRLRKYDSSIYYATKTIEIDSSMSSAYYILALSYAMKKDSGNAAYYFEKLNSSIPPDIKPSKQLKELQEIIKKINKASF